MINYLLTKNYNNLTFGAKRINIDKEKREEMRKKAEYSLIEKKERGFKQNNEDFNSKYRENYYLANAHNLKNQDYIE